MLVPKKYLPTHPKNAKEREGREQGRKSGCQKIWTAAVDDPPLRRRGSRVTLPPNPVVSTCHPVRYPFPLFVLLSILNPNLSPAHCQTRAISSWEKQQIVDNGNLLKKIMVMEIDDVVDDDRNLFSCAICGLSEGDASNLTTQNNLQTNATVGCGHQLYVDRL